ncbi:transporter substrate-binding domain-containing protein [Chromobacterium sp. IRSSSOUMB001]|uniref:substrate-binding periplasmic protein n=1 Tax=Chromobacterium sp. IRSSSOUMB001 TaxID=2927123 RepID=UPI0020BF4CAB|nr:transporter substrate-binding domain-containing protein [Chromobacterium sp. IRSSSOUMB001]
MKSAFVHVALLLGALSVGVRAESTSPRLRLLTEDYPPFNIALEEGKIGGLSTDILRELFQRAGIPYSMELLPWLRAYAIAQQESNSCVYSTSRTQSRESQFKWVGPLVSNSWSLFAGPHSPAGVAMLEDARGYTIGSYKGSGMSQYLADLGFKLDLARADDLNAKKLVAGHIDFWASGEFSGAYIASANRLPIRLLFSFNTVQMYLACNPGLDERIVQKLNKTLSNMQRDGVVDALRKHYR